MDRLRGRYTKRDLMGLVYVLPWIIGFALFQLVPFIQSFTYSFTDKSLAGSGNFLGLQNYKEILTFDPDFQKVLKVTIIYVLIAAPGKVLFALFIALILNKDVRGINVFRTIYYLPSIFGGSIAIALVWRFLFDYKGVINGWLDALGMDRIGFLGNPNYALITIAMIPIWQFGSSMVLFLTALKNVPKELYEAAEVDGSGKLRTFFKVTLPMISPIMLFNLVMQVVNCFQEFSAPFAITNGGPNKATFLYGYKLYREAFVNLRMGYSCALSWIFFLLMVVITLLIFASSKKWVFYSDGR